jgi:hypothetical protein
VGTLGEGGDSQPNRPEWALFVRYTRHWHKKSRKLMSEMRVSLSIGWHWQDWKICEAGLPHILHKFTSDVKISMIHAMAVSCTLVNQGI